VVKDTGKIAMKEGVIPGEINRRDAEKGGYGKLIHDTWYRVS
jgi:hypothetical protein